MREFRKIMKTFKTALAYCSNTEKWPKNKKKKDEPAESSTHMLWYVPVTKTDEELCKSLEPMKNKYAVLVVDVFRDMGSDNVNNIRDLVSYADSRNIPTVFTELQTYTDESLIESVNNPIIVSKENDDAFENTDLQYILEKLNAQELIVCGYNANACVYKTSKSAVDKGFKVHTSSDILIGSNFGNERVKIDSEALEFYRTKTNFIEEGDYKSLPIFRSMESILAAD